MKKLRGLFVCGLALVMMLAMVVVMTPQARAYSNAIQWQIGFSGTCSIPSLCGPAPGVPGTFGFWGWCVFGGSSGSSTPGTVGITGDCDASDYFHIGPTVVTQPIQVSIDLTSWAIGTGSAFLPPGAPGFFFTGGTVKVQGPGAAQVGAPTGVPLPLTFPCPALSGLKLSPPPTDFSLLAGSLCDSGIPAIPGHFSFHPFPGFAIEIQVVKIQ